MPYKVESEAQTIDFGVSSARGIAVGHKGAEHRLKKMRWPIIGWLRTFGTLDSQ
jgi:hypothetical protein